MTDGSRRTKHYFFHSWDHKHPVHRSLVKLANRALRQVPMALKYRISDRMRSSRYPYVLVVDGDLVVQIGAPADTLNSGRSRGMGLALRSGRGGVAVVIEPEPRSCEEFRRAAEKLSLPGVRVVNCAVTDAEQDLVLRVDASHPATNFIEGRARYTEEEKAKFSTHTIRGRPLIDILYDADTGDAAVKVLSITTNGAEKEILRGAEAIISRVEYVALAGVERDLYEQFMSELGFEFVSFDDRGITYRNKMFGR